MKDKRRGLFSLSEEDVEYFEDSQDKFEIVSCSMDGNGCSNHRAEINKSYLESNNSLRIKNYQKSIEALTSAYYKTIEINEPSCLNCAEFFRSTIKQSLEEIHDNLEVMSKSRFQSAHFKSSFELVQKVLDEIKQKAN